MRSVAMVAALGAGLIGCKAAEEPPAVRTVPGEASPVRTAAAAPTPAIDAAAPAPLPPPTTIDAAAPVASAPVDARPKSPAKDSKAAEEAAMLAELDALGSLDTLDSNPSHRRPGADLAAQMGDDTVALVHVGGGTGRAIGGTLKPGAASGDDDALTDVGVGRAGVRALLLEQKAFDDTSLTADAVAAKIASAYLLGIKRCYQDRLEADPSVKGVVHLKLAVNASGHVADHTVSGIGPTLDVCLTGLMAGWRFAVPKDGDGTATDAAFEIVMSLSPS